VPNLNSSKNWKILQVKLEESHTYTHTHMTDLQAIRDRNFTNPRAFCYPAIEEKQAI
jgi:hypothetical protein